MNAAAPHRTEPSPPHPVVRPIVEPPPAQLVFADGPDAGRTVPLGQHEVIVGRSTQADLVIDRRTVSQLHAKIVPVPGGHELVDLSSTNGTYSNGVRIGRVMLQSGHRIHLGDVGLVYQRVTVPAIGQGSAISPWAPPALALPAAEPPEPNLIDHLITLLRFLRRNLALLILFPMLGIVAGIASMYLAPPSREAAFELTLDTTAMHNPLEQHDRKTLSYFREPQARFLRPGLVRETLEEMGETDVTASRIRGIRNSLTLTRKSPELLAGTFTAEEPDFAVGYLEKHLANYMDDEIDDTLGVLNAEVETLRGKLAQTVEELTATEHAIREFKSDNLDKLPDNADDVLTRVSELSVEQRHAQAAVAQAEAMLVVAKKQLKDESVQTSVQLDHARPFEEEIADVKKQLAVARASGKGDAHPEVLGHLRQLEILGRLRNEARRNSGGEIKQEVNVRTATARHAYEAARAQLEVSRRELARVNQALQNASQSMQGLPEVQAEYAELTRRYAVMQERHNMLLDRLGRSETQLELERAAALARMDVVTPPHLIPTSPVKTWGLRLGIAFTLGLMLAVGIGLLREVRRLVAARGALGLS